MPIELEVQNASDAAGIPSNEQFLKWLQPVVDRYRPSQSLQLSLRIVDEAESAEFNQRFRSKPGPTNVLSFPAELPPEVELMLLGDLLVCAPLVAREAAEQGKSPEAHWAHLVIHGLLHLLGFDHQSESEAAVMETAETELLLGLGYPDPYRS